MRTPLAPVACLLLLGSAGFLTLSLTRGQDSKPAPAAPRPLKVPPLPAARPARDLARLPPLHRQMFLSARRGAEWLSRLHGVKGRFEHGLLPALNAALDGDRPARQAGAAFALARAAHFLRDDDYAARATQAVLALLEDIVTDEPVRQAVLSSPAGNRPGSAALLVLAVHELPGPGEDLLDRAEVLCNDIRRQLPDGSSPPGGGGTAGAAKFDPAAEHHAVQALYALVRSQHRRPAKWKTDAVRKALPCHLARWRQHKDRDSVCWLTAAFAEAYLLTKERAFAEAVFEMNDWLCGLQYAQLDPRRPRWLGGFMACAGGKVAEEAPDVGSACCALALAEACRVTRQLPDVARHQRYEAALERGLQFLTTLQYSEADTQHFADWYRPRLVGGFHANHQDGNLRIDYTEHALLALVQYLAHVAKVP